MHTLRVMNHMPTSLHCEDVLVRIRCALSSIQTSQVVFYLAGLDIAQCAIQAHKHIRTAQACWHVTQDMQIDCGRGHDQTPLVITKRPVHVQHTQLYINLQI